jgi:molybdopterin biosynthesis enzyme
VDGSGLGNALPSVTKGVTAPKPINTRVPEESNTCNTSNTSYAVTARAEFAECQTPELDKSRVDNYNRDFSDTALSNSANSAVPTANADDEEEERVVL